MPTSNTSPRGFEPYTLCDAPWESEALSIYPRPWLEHQGRDIRIAEGHRVAFETTRPTHLEIGSHRGRFLAGIARAHPRDHVLGMEIRRKYHRLAEEYLQKRAVENAAHVRVNAKLAVIIALPLESLDAVYVNFPDPWWKARQAHRRLLDTPFLRVLARRLKPRGRLYLKSDVFEYLHAVRRFAADSEAFRPLPPERWPDESNWARSAREAKCMRAAIPFGRGYYERLPTFDITRPIEPEPLPASVWDDMVVGVEDIRGRPPIDKEMRRLTARAAAERVTSAVAQDEEQTPESSSE